MMMLVSVVVVMVAVIAVSAAFGLEGSLDLFKIRPEATEHLFDHMVGPNAKNHGLEFRSANADYPDAMQGASADRDLYA